MLEVRHLKKEYKTKKGAVTRALDDVSLTFPETGMVFILGKSGSGKSTLLNVCGGLDRYDSGEIIIKGKSSKDFSAQDFDSYRNTYVGFVFQEYNILDEFTVEDNVALALELQNKKRDKETIDRILADVDMSEFAGRKPNTLSGGQKQRVAIARALVKEPEIIMADEPTGALDSKTGQQVFDTLKKLSKTKLILVVSHDREFAEQYGDRIIELKDGKVISDMTRSQNPDVTRNVKFFGADTVCVNNGSAITDKDMEDIRNFLMRSGGSAVISTSRDQISTIKSSLPEMDVGEFEDLKEQPTSKQYPQQKLIRSKFPLRHAIKMGAGSLKSKPIRLIFTVLLSIMAFILFGLASTVMFFDQRSVTAETMMSSDYEYISLAKRYYLVYQYYEGDELRGESEGSRSTVFSNKDYSDICERFPGAIAAAGINTYLENVDVGSYAEQFYSKQLSGVLMANSSLNLLYGTMPVHADEALISKYTYDMLKHSSTKLEYSSSAGESFRGEVVAVTDFSGLTYSSGHPVTLVCRMRDMTFEFKITGVYDCGEYPSSVSELKEAADKNTTHESWQDRYTWQSACSAGLYNWLGITSEFFNANKSLFTAAVSENANYFEYSDASIDISVSEGYSYSFNRMNIFDPSEPDMLDVYSLSGDRLKSKLSGMNIAVNANIIKLGIMDKLNYLNNAKWSGSPDPQAVAAYNKAMSDYIAEHPEPQSEDYGDYEQYQQAHNNWENQLLAEADAARAAVEQLYAEQQSEYSALMSMRVGDVTELNKFLADAQKLATGFDGTLGDYDKISMRINADNSNREVTIAGVFFGGLDDYVYYGVYLSPELYGMAFIRQGGYSKESTKYVMPKDAYISALYLPYDKSSAATDRILNMAAERGDDDSYVAITNPVVEQLDMVGGAMKEMGDIFLYIGIALAVFAFLLMFNFISVSISAKKKEIGILRAIGARGIDVFKIFMSESAIIALICIAIAIGGTYALCLYINKTLVEGTMIAVALFVFGPMSLASIVGIAFVTALVSTIIPVAIYSRKPPIASIRAL